MLVALLAARCALAQPHAPSVLWSIELASDSYGGGCVADVDGDGSPEIAFATYFGDSKVRVVRARDGSEVWTFDAGSEAGKGDSCLDASLRIADLDADGDLELVVPVSDDSLVHAFDARTGRKEWTHDAGHAHCIDTPPCIADADGDARLDVIVGTFKGELHVIKGDGSSARVLTIAPGAVQSCPVVLDANADGRPDLIAANFKGDHRLRCVSIDGGEIWSVLVGDHMYHGPAVADLDADAAPDLVQTAYNGKVVALRARDGSTLWEASPGDHYFMSPPAIADLDLDGSPEVVVASVNLTVLRADGSVLYSVPTDEATGVMASVTRGVSIADLSGDGRLDLAFCNSRGLLRVVDGMSGRTLYEFDPAPILGYTPAHSSHGPVIADFNADGLLDLFYVCGDSTTRRGRAFALTGFAGRGPDWPMLRHDVRNTGFAGAAPAGPTSAEPRPRQPDQGR